MLNSSFLLCAVLFLGVVAGNAQASLETEFIVDNYFYYRNIDDDSQINPNNTWNLAQEDFKGEFFPIFSYEGEASKIQFESKLSYSTDSNEFNNYNVQELYYENQIYENLNFKFGKQLINWGSGLVWNPTNFYVQKNPLRLVNRLEGAESLNIEQQIGNYVVNYVVVSEEDEEGFNSAIKINRTEGSLVFDFSYAHLGQNNYQFGIDLNYAGDYFTLYSESSFSNYTNTYLVNSSGTIEESNGDDYFSGLYLNSVLGGSIILSSAFTLAAEYNYRSDFNTDSTYIQFISNLPRNAQLYDAIGMGKHRIYTSLRYRDEYERFNVSVSIFHDFVTGQSTVFPSFQFNTGNFKLEFTNYFYNEDAPVYDFQSLLIFSLYF